MRLRDDLDLLDAAITQAADATGVPIQQVRKDFWLTEALRGAVAQSHADGVRVVFKGGTSLSKVFGLIERFSEDVDILIVAPGATTAVNTAMKAIIRAAECHIGVEGELDIKTADTGVFRAVTLPYPGRTPPDRGVLLEVGARGGALPNAEHHVTSIVAPIAEQMLGETVEEAPGFDVHVLAPARTLIEKFVILHEAHLRPEGPARNARIAKTARHYYDVWCLLGDPQVRDDLAIHGAGILAREVCQHSKAMGLPAVSYPSGGFSSSPAFTAKSTPAQRKAYSTNLPQLLWPTAALPDFAACLQRITEHAHLL